MSDCYDRMMNLATPIHICHRNEEFRHLLRDMLTKHGFFHVLDSASTEEMMLLEKKEAKKSFLLLEGKLINEDLARKLSGQKNFVILTQAEDERTLMLAASFGVKHLLSFPFSSQVLFEKISTVAQ